MALPPSAGGRGRPARRLEPGDLVKLDVSAERGGYFAAAATVARSRGFRIIRDLPGRGRLLAPHDG